jgi:hypothetical protein
MALAMGTPRELQLELDRLEVALQFVERQRERLVHLAVHRERPARSVHLLGHFRSQAIVAYEVAVVRRDVVVEQVRRSLSVGRAIAQHDEAVLAREDQRLRRVGECRGDEPGRVVAMERDLRSNQSRHGREAGTLEEAASIRVRHAPEHERVGALRILGIEFTQATFLARFFSRASLPHGSRRRNPVSKNMSRSEYIRTGGV